MQHRGVSPQARTKLAAANHLQSTGILAIAAAALAAAPRTPRLRFSLSERVFKKSWTPVVGRKESRKMVESREHIS
jgi:hypothetical protein